jgi:hypothetical protein
MKPIDLPTFAEKAARRLAAMKSFHTTDGRGKSGRIRALRAITRALNKISITGSYNVQLVNDIRDMAYLKINAE